jgi:lysophospholipase L1-like esterase
VSRRALVATLSCLAALAAPPDAIAQGSAPAPAPPSLQVVSARLSQVDDDLVAELRFSRVLPVAEIDPTHERSICIVLSPSEPSRREVCVAPRDGRLVATIASVAENGLRDGPVRALRQAHVVADGDFLRLRIPASELKLQFGRDVTWRGVLTWHDGGPCEALADALACTQLFPSPGDQRLGTSGSPRPPARRAAHLRLLATGDSMIQLVDNFLTSGLQNRRATVVRSDAHVSTGISKLGMLDWLRKARGQAGGFKPDVTVVFLGANDGFPMKTASGARVGCCGAGWIAEYARRVESMMRSYRRHGRALVYWMTLPAPRAGNFARVFRAVNPAISRAAARVGDGVRVIDLGAVFTPDGRFHQTITYRGQTIDARQPDGIHLSTAGARVAASVVIDRLRADGALPRNR